MKKVLHLITDLDVGGTERMLLKTLPLLHADKHMVCSLTTKGDIGEQLDDAGITVQALGSASLFHPRTYIRVFLCIKHYQPDILQTYLAHADIVGRVVGRLAGVHTIICSIRSKLNEPRFVPLIWLYRVTAFLVNQYLFNSYSTAHWYQQRGIPKKKIDVIVNGLSLADFSRQFDPSGIRRKIGISDTAIILGCLGKLRPEKGHIFLIQAMKHLVEKFPELIALFIGGGPLDFKLRGEVRQHSLEKHVRFLGNRSDITELLRTVDIFVLPTLYEGMSNAILEAMAAKRPIVTTDIPENRELVTNDREALFVPPKNARALADALQKLLSDAEMAARLAHAAYDRVAKHYSLEHTLKRLEKLYSGF